MRKKDFLSEFLGNPVRTRLVRFLVVAGDRHHTLADICKKVQIKKKQTVQKELDTLTRLEILTTSFTKPEARTGKEKKPSREKTWGFDREHPYAQALRLFVRDTQIPVNEDMVSRLRRAGKLHLVVVSGRFLDDSKDDRAADFLIVGDPLSEEKVLSVLKSLEAQTGHEVKYALFSPKEFKYRLDINDRLIRDVLDYPHHILLDKMAIF